jgi:hypothetical protein
VPKKAGLEKLGTHRVHFTLTLKRSETNAVLLFYKHINVFKWYWLVPGGPTKMVKAVNEVKNECQ